ncbi:MAG TPA: hypothetical protein VD833_00480 [Vicinamibacterales bacterium]|nr:hypothetical protein [Vicinamibacterales bacterium]
MNERRVAAATAALAAALVMAGGRQVFTQVNVPGIDKPVQVFSGEITGTATWTNDRYWVLRGAVFVREGATLDIQAGTTIVGEAGSVGTLIVERGGRLNAIGTVEQPIVFTSDQAPGQRARGDWGGIILNGRAPVNLDGGEGEGEADTGVYGGSDPDDNSGSLRYVRVEFAGTEFSPDNELNGIAFQAVGRGGTYDHLQVHMNKDDGLEWFGGTADVKYAMVTNAGDDSFDWTFGWSGRGQFIAVSQRGDDADAGIEADNNEFNNENLPRSSPTLYNLTFCGDPDRNEGAESTRGWLLRRGTAGELRNFIIQGFKNVGLEVNGTSTFREARAGSLRVSHGAIFNTGANGRTYFQSNSNATISTAALVAEGVFSNIRTGQNPGIGDCHNHENPDFLPTSVSTIAGGQLGPATPPNDGFFEVTTYIGAFSPDPELNWAAGWTRFPQN